MRELRAVPVDGSPESVAGLVGALRAALDGSGPAVLPAPAPPAIRAERPPTAGETSPPVAEGASPHAVGVDGPLAADAGRLVVGSEVAVVVTTSGSTGQPKHVMLGAAALTASARATEERLGGPGRWLLALPAGHVAGVQVVLRALLAGQPPVVQDVRAGFRPSGLAEAARLLPRAERRYTSLVPTQLGRILDEGGAACRALAGFDAVLIGGAALDPALRERAETVGIRVVTTYGMSETCGGCVYDGVPLAGVRVRIGPDGRIFLGGATLAAGYLGNPNLTAEAFDGGWFRTSDLGSWSDGRLTVLGRADDVIVTGGEKVAPAAVERVLAAQPGIAAACVVGIPDEEWGQVVAAAIVAGDTAQARFDILRAAVRSVEGRAAVPRRFAVLSELPLLGIGKPDRRAVAALFR